MRSDLFDPGLQAERTLLSWHRTCLALGVASVGVIRFTITTLGVAAIGMGIVGVALAAGALLAAPVGYRRMRDELTSQRPLSAVGLALALMAATLLLLGLVCAAYVILGAPAVAAGPVALSRGC